MGAIIGTYRGRASPSKDGQHTLRLTSHDCQCDRLIVTTTSDAADDLVIVAKHEQDTTRACARPPSSDFFRIT